LAERQRLYESTADLSVDTDGRNVHQVACEVVRRLRRRGEL
jgi:shikimate kinase